MMPDEVMAAFGLSISYDDFSDESEILDNDELYAKFPELFVTLNGKRSYIIPFCGPERDDQTLVQLLLVFNIDYIGVTVNAYAEIAEQLDADKALWQAITDELDEKAVAGRFEEWISKDGGIEIYEGEFPGLLNSGDESKYYSRGSLLIQIADR